MCLRWGEKCRLFFICFCLLCNVFFFFFLFIVVQCEKYAIFFMDFSFVFYVTAHSCYGYLILFYQLKWVSVYNYIVNIAFFQFQCNLHQIFSPYLLRSASFLLLQFHFVYGFLFLVKCIFFSIPLHLIPMNLSRSYEWQFLLFFLLSVAALVSYDFLQKSIFYFFIIVAVLWMYSRLCFSSCDSWVLTAFKYREKNLYCHTNEKKK